MRLCDLGILFYVDSMYLGMVVDACIRSSFSRRCRFGPRLLFTIVLCAAAIPTACTGLIQSAQDLVILRVFIGFAGGTFVMCQYWATSMFTMEVVGTANAVSFSEPHRAMPLRFYPLTLVISTFATLEWSVTVGWRLGQSCKRIYNSSHSSSMVQIRF